MERLPSVCAAAARAVISSRESSPFSSPGELLLRGVLDPALFAPIANLITVRSDVFRVVCTARIPHPSDPADPGLFTAERRVEAVIDRSGGRIRVVSWKEIFE